MVGYVVSIAGKIAPSVVHGIARRAVSMNLF